MSKHKQNNDGIYFLGESSTDVTGSQYLVQFGGKKILLECGLYQSKSNSYLDSYKINSKKFGFKPSEICCVCCIIRKKIKTMQFVTTDCYIRQI